MGQRIELHEILADILGSRNVYYQPPSNVKMKFPAIEYHLSRYNTKRADNKLYTLDTSYDVTLIELVPDSDKVKSILELPLCSFDRSFISDNLYHTVFTIYY